MVSKTCPKKITPSPNCQTYPNITGLKPLQEYAIILKSPLSNPYPPCSVSISNFQFQLLWGHLMLLLGSWMRCIANFHPVAETTAAPRAGGTWQPARGAWDHFSCQKWTDRPEADAILVGIAQVNWIPVSHLVR